MAKNNNIENKKGEKKDCECCVSCCSCCSGCSSSSEDNVDLKWNPELWWFQQRLSVIVNMSFWRFCLLQIGITFIFFLFFLTIMFLFLGAAWILGSIVQML